MVKLEFNNKEKNTLTAILSCPTLPSNQTKTPKKQNIKYNEILFFELNCFIESKKKSLYYLPKT